MIYEDMSEANANSRYEYSNNLQFDPLFVKSKLQKGFNPQQLSKVSTLYQ